MGHLEFSRNRRRPVSQCIYRRKYTNIYRSKGGGEPGGRARIVRESGRLREEGGGWCWRAGDGFGKSAW